MIARRIKPILWATLATAALATGASATTLGNGVNALGAPILPDLGTILTTTGLLPFNTNSINPANGVSGHFQEWVLRRSSDNKLDFILKAEVDTLNAVSHMPQEALHRITLTPFGTFTTDVGFDAANTTSGISGDTQPATMDRGLVGAEVGFNFFPLIPPDNAVLPGHNTYDLIIKTNAPNYEIGQFGLIDGGGNTYSGLVPAVPEPGSLALLMTGGLPLLGLLRRRGRTA